MDKTKEKLDALFRDLLSVDYELSVKALTELNETPNIEEKITLSDEVIQKLIFLATDSSDYVREYAFSIIGRFKIALAFNNVKYASVKDESLGVRSQAIITLGQIFTKQTELEILDFLINTLAKEENSILRTAAAHALGLVRNKKGTDTLVAVATKDIDENVRHEAVKALGLIGDDKATPNLLSLVKKETSFPVRMSALVSLGQIGSPTAINELVLVILKDHDFSNRGAACAGLAYSKDAKVIEPLIKVLFKDSNLVPRRAAALTLGELYSRFKDNQIKDALKKIIGKEEEDESLIHNAKFALKKIIDIK